MQAVFWGCLSFGLSCGVYMNVAWRAVLFLWCIFSPSFVLGQSHSPVLAPAPPPPVSVPQTSSPILERILKGKEKLSVQVLPSGTTDKSMTSQEGRPAPGMGTEAPSSPFERYIQGKQLESVSTDIVQFGYDLFNHPPSTFAPGEMVPVGPDYLLGPGDEVKVNLWGKLNDEYRATIDQNGQINLFQVGTLSLSGLTFSEAQAFIASEYNRYYKPSEVKTNISMGQLRTIHVFVVGNAARPGAYTLSSFSTLVNALFAAGGPLKMGTLRDIQVKRNGKTLVHFDMYDFLLRGDKTEDIRLMPEDVIFIPVAGPLVGVAGQVKRPAIYEMKGRAGLKDIIEMAGGLSATGYPYRVQMERVEEGRSKTILDVNLQEAQQEITLQDWDWIKVFPINQIVTNPVELVGNILRPGTYQWKEGLRVKDILPSPDDLLPDTLLEYALVERLMPPAYHKEYLSFKIGKLLLDKDETENILLKPYDILTVFNRWEVMEKKKVRITGAVNKSGEYEYRPNMRLSDLLKLSGGLKRHAYMREAELTRVTPTAEGPRTDKIILHHLEKAIETDPAYDIPLQEDDYLFVNAVPEWELYRVVHIKGEVKFPGDYTIKKGEKILSLIDRAGGFTDKAYLKGAVFTRESVRLLQQKQLNEAIDRLEHQLLVRSVTVIETALSSELALQQRAELEQRKLLIEKMRAAQTQGRISLHLDERDRFAPSPSNIALEEGDSLFVPERPSQIQVIGSVYNQGAFLYDPKEDVPYYIDLAGGMADEADRDDAYILRVDGTAVSQYRGGGWGWRWRWRSVVVSSTLDAGDTIVVPQDVDRIHWLRGTKDITQILYQIAVTTGILLRVF